MYIKIETYIYVDVADTDEGEAAASTIDSSLLSQFNGFPHGEVMGVSVEQFTEATHEELDEKGFLE
jgi:hypothetical protein